jgi:hypothetical protein
MFKRRHAHAVSPAEANNHDMACASFRRTRLDRRDTGAKRGTLYIFRPNNDQTTQHIRLKGLTPEAQYGINSEDGSVPEEARTGNDLMSTGLKVKLPRKYSSDLIYLEQSK